MNKDQTLLDKLFQKDFDDHQTYRVYDLTLREVKRIGGSRWQRSHKNPYEWAMFPLTLIIVMMVIFLRVNPYWLSVALIPTAYGYWSSLRQAKLREKAAEQFVNSDSVRKND